MIELIRPFRGIAIALVVLLVTAGVAFATAGPGSHLGLLTSQATEATDGPDESDAPEESEAPEASDAPEAIEVPDASEGTDAEYNDSTDAHGALMTAASQMTTPAGFPNHGAFVSCVAHMKTATLATIDWSTVTPALCKASGHGKGHWK